MTGLKYNPFNNVSYFLESLAESLNAIFTHVQPCKVTERTKYEYTVLLCWSPAVNRGQSV